MRDHKMNTLTLIFIHGIIWRVISFARLSEKSELITVGVIPCMNMILSVFIL